LTTEYVEDYIQLPPDGVGKKTRAIKRPDDRYESVIIPLSLNGEVELKTLLDKLASRLPRKIEADDGTGIYAEIHRTNNALQTYVKNFPANYPLPATQVSDLKKVTVENIVRRIEADDGTGVYAEIYRTNNALQTSIKNDEVGLAKETTLSSRLPRKIEADDGTGVYAEIHRRNNNLRVSLESDQIDLIKTLKDRVSRYYVSRRCLLKTGIGAFLRAEDIDPLMWYDDLERIITNITPATTSYFNLDTNVMKVGVLGLAVRARVVAEGQVLHIRAVNKAGNILFEDTWTKIEFEEKVFNVTNAYFEAPCYPEKISFEAWVEAEGQEGRIEWFTAYIEAHGVFNLAHGWTGLIGEGHGVKPLLIDDEGKLRVKVEPIARGYKDFDVTTTTEATTEVIPAPATGYKIRLFDVHFGSTADVITALRFGATGSLMWALPTKGAISKNLINRERDAPEATGVYVYISGAGRVLGSLGYEVVPV